MFHGAAATLTTHANRADTGNIFLGKVVDNVGPQHKAVDKEEGCPVGVSQLTSKPNHRGQISVRHERSLSPSEVITVKAGLVRKPEDYPVLSVNAELEEKLSR